MSSLIKGDSYLSYNEVLGVPLKRNDRKNWLYFLIGFIILVLFVFIFVIIYNNFMKEDSENSSSVSDENVNIGALVKVTDYQTRSRKITKQQVIKPKTGKFGKLQSHSLSYYNVGKFPSEYKKINIGKKKLSDGNESATSICEITKGCNGVEYNHQTEEAYLIMSDITTESVEKPSFDFNDPVQTYLKIKLRPKFKNVVFGFSGIRLLRYYMSDELEPKVNKNNIMKPGVVKFFNGVKREILWVPFRISNYGGFIGKYYDVDNNLIYTDKNVGEYNLPIDLHKYDRLYVIYEK